MAPVEALALNNGEIDSGGLGIATVRAMVSAHKLHLDEEEGESDSKVRNREREGVEREQNDE